MQRFMKVNTNQLNASSFAKTAEPTTGDSNATKWDPMSSGKNNVYRVGNTLQMEDDFKSAAIK